MKSKDTVSSNMTIHNSNNPKKQVPGVVCKMFLEHGVCTWGDSCKFEHPPKKACKNKTRAKAPKKANTNNRAGNSKQTVAYESNQDSEQHQLPYQPCISITDPYFGNPYGQMFDTYGVVYGNVPLKYAVEQKQSKPELYELAKGDKPNRIAAAKLNNKVNIPSNQDGNKKVIFAKRSISAPPVIMADCKLTNQELYSAVRGAASCEHAISLVTDVTDMAFVPDYYSHVQKYLTSGKSAVLTLESKWLYDLVSLHVRHAVINSENLKMLIQNCLETIQAHRNGTRLNATNVCHAIACIKAIGDHYCNNYQF